MTLLVMQGDAQVLCYVLLNRLVAPAGHVSSYLPSPDSGGCVDHLPGHSLTAAVRKRLSLQRSCTQPDCSNQTAVSFRLFQSVS